MSLKKYLFVSLIILPFLFIALYISRINIVADVSLTVEGVSKGTFSKIQFYGSSPLNRMLVIHRSSNIFNFSSLGNKTFFRHLYLVLPDSAICDSLTLHLNIGKDEFMISGSTLGETFILSDNTPHLYVLSAKFYQASLPEMLKSFTSWPEKIRKIFYLIGIIILLLLIFIFLKKSKFGHRFAGRVRRLLVSWARAISYLFQKKLFLTITIILTSFLLCVFLVVLHFGVFCNFSAYVFILLVYGILMLLTFVFRLLLSVEKINNIRLSFTSFFFIIIVVEFFLRFFDVNASYLERNTLCYERVFHKYRNSRYYTREPLMKISYTTTEFTYERDAYAEGFTQPMLTGKKKKNEYRILALGDSFTEGVGTHKDSTWLKFLSDSLQKLYPDKIITTFNAGVVSSDPVFQYVLLTEKFNHLDFDMVFVCTNESDLLDIVLRGGFERFQPNNTVKYKERPSWEWLYGLSYISRLVVINGLGYNHILMKQSDYDIKRMTSLKTIYQTHLMFYDYAQKNNIQLLSVFHPTQSEILTPDYFMLKYVLKRLRHTHPDMHVVDMQHYFIDDLKINRQNIYDYFWKIDGHHNTKGYKSFANGLLKYIKEEKLLD